MKERAERGRGMEKDWGVEGIGTFEEIYRDVLDIMCNMLYKYYYIDGYDEEDLMQEMSLVLLDCIQNYDKSRGVDFKVYVKICFDMALRDKLKASRRYKNRANYSAVSLQDFMVGASDVVLEDIVEDKRCLDPAEIVASNDFTERVLGRAREVLSKIEYSVFCKKVLLDRSYKEICVDLGLGKKTVDNSIQRAKRKLRGDYRIACEVGCV